MVNPLFLFSVVFPLLEAGDAPNARVVEIRGWMSDLGVALFLFERSEDEFETLEEDAEEFGVCGDEKSGGVGNGTKRFNKFELRANDEDGVERRDDGDGLFVLSSEIEDLNLLMRV
jgi:hypothetical protein